VIDPGEGLETSVVYIAYAPHGEALYERFISAYERFTPTIAHRLLIVQKGWELPVPVYAKRILMHDSPSDIDTYARVARDQGGILCFLNSSSEPLTGDWLEYLAAPLTSPRIGITGATGSRELNPHIRTNAFAMRAQTLQSLGLPTHIGREHAMALEHGQDNITLRVMRQGLTALVVGRDGVYMPPVWDRARTFRRDEQENLLIADNRTRQYADAAEPLREWLRNRAWPS
jgi:hypothetical protein